MNKLILALITLLIILSCKKTHPSISSIKKEDLKGYYEQQGEGEIIEINDSIVTSYYSSTFNCFPAWKVSRNYFNTKTPTLTVIDDSTFVIEEGYTIFTYKKLKKKPELCKELTEGQIQSNRYNFETLWHTFNEQYAFFKERNINWKTIKHKYEVQFTEETPTFEFYLLLEKMISELKDEHSDIEVPEEFEEQWDELNASTDTLQYDKLASKKILNKYVSNYSTYNLGQVSWGFIDNSTAYIQLNGMDGLANYNPKSINQYWEIAEESDDYFKDVIEGAHYISGLITKEITNTEQCIIDLRFNGGGYDMVGLAFISHFIDKEYDIFKKRRRFKNGFAGEQTIKIKPSNDAYLKPVYILTSHYTVSAAETTIVATLNFPNFKRVGSNSNGALSDVLSKELPNGWTYEMSNEVYESMDGKLYEVTGIPADINIKYPKDEEEFFKTLYRELNTADKAIELVLNRDN